MPFDSEPEGKFERRIFFSARAWWRDIGSALRFLTRLPLPHAALPAEEQRQFEALNVEPTPQLQATLRLHSTFEGTRRALIDQLGRPPHRLAGISMLTR